MRAAFYECEVTPPIGGHMPGYYRPNPATDVVERLYTKALVMEENGKYAAIVALDTCEYISQLTQVILPRVSEMTDIPPENICIHITHTHKGAPIEDDPNVGQVADAAYRDVCCRLCADAVILAYRRLEEVTVKFGQVSAPDGIAFNRNYVRTDGVIRSHNVGDGIFSHMLAGTDTDLPVLVFEKEGTPVGMIWSFALHQDCAGPITGYTADYSGIVAAEMKKVYGQEFVSLFMIGAAGDINHVPNNSKEEIPYWRHREIGMILTEYAQKAMQKAEPVGEGLAIKKEILQVKRRQMTAEEAAPILARWEANGDWMRPRNLRYYVENNKKEYSQLAIQAIRIGNTCLYAFPGEMYVNFGKRVKATSPFQNNIVTENNNCFGGYIPTLEAFDPKSDLYEISLCYCSRHVPEAGDILTDNILEIAKELS